ncbi:ATP synthase F1 subunit delta [Patescibacteria group bacterium]|nr:ATP synthase F1 subunit delta [Patescibacteria group bacterium]
MRKITPKKYAISLYEVTQNASRDAIGESVKNFIKLLVQHKRLSQAEKVIKAFSKYADEQENILEVSVTTVDKMADKQRRSLIKELEKHFSKKIVLIELIDKALLGGIVLHYGDTVADGSVKQRLSLLAQSLTK